MRHSHQIQFWGFLSSLWSIFEGIMPLSLSYQSLVRSGRMHNWHQKAGMMRWVIADGCRMAEQRSGRRSSSSQQSLTDFFVQLHLPGAQEQPPGVPLVRYSGNPSRRLGGEGTWPAAYNGHDSQKTNFISTAARACALPPAHRQPWQLELLLRY